MKDEKYLVALYSFIPFGPKRINLLLSYFKTVEKVLPGGKGEEKIIEIIKNEPLHLDEIARISKLSVSDISSLLAIMEMKGIVKNIGNGVYKKV
jgi:DNA-binding MarR family transcriptional regulator